MVGSITFRMTKSLAFFTVVLLLYQCAPMQKHWRRAKSIDTISGYENFLTKYPSSRFIASAKNKIDSLSFVQAMTMGSNKAYQDYITNHPEGRYIVKANTLIDSLAFLDSRMVHSIQAYQNYLARHPDGTYVDEAAAQIEFLHYTNCIKDNNIERLRRFLSRYPNGTYVHSVRAKIDTLAFKEAAVQNTQAALAKYKSEFPEGAFVEITNTRLEKLVYEQAAAADDYALFGTYLGEYPLGRYVQKATERRAFLKQFEKMTLIECARRLVNNPAEENLKYIEKRLDRIRSSEEDSKINEIRNAVGVSIMYIYSDEGTNRVGKFGLLERSDESDIGRILRLVYYAISKSLELYNFQIDDNKVLMADFTGFIKFNPEFGAKGMDNDDLFCLTLGWEDREAVEAREETVITFVAGKARKIPSDDRKTFRIHKPMSRVNKYYDAVAGKTTYSLNYNKLFAVLLLDMEAFLNKSR